MPHALLPPPCCAAAPQGVNCGLVYVQNASSHGPAGWLGYEVARRTLTAMENVQGTLDANPQFAGSLEWLDKTVLYEQVGTGEKLLWMAGALDCMRW